MFDHILVPTDGSKFGNKAAKAVIKLAADTHARLTFYSAVESNIPTFTELSVVPRATVERIDRAARKSAQANLDELIELAKARGVSCDSVVGQNPVPWKGIIAEAMGRNCDLICMASHGRRGIKGVLLGSVTQQVLTHSRIPVLVLR